MHQVTQLDCGYLEQRINFERLRCIWILINAACFQGRKKDLIICLKTVTATYFTTMYGCNCHYSVGDRTVEKMNCNQARISYTAIKRAVTKVYNKCCGILRMTLILDKQLEKPFFCSCHSSFKLQISNRWIMYSPFVLILLTMMMMTTTIMIMIVSCQNLSNSVKNKKSRIECTV